MTAADLVLDQPAEAPLREGRDFSSPQELARRTQVAPLRCLPQPTGLALAAAVLREVLWMLWTGSPPGGVPWDEQPAWRAELCEAFLIEWERTAALNADLG